MISSDDSGWKTSKRGLPAMAFASLRASLRVASLAAVFVGNFPFFDVDCTLSSFSRHHWDVFRNNRAVKEQNWS